MGLSTKNTAGSSSGEGFKITDGVYANVKKITKIADHSGKDIERFGKSFDIFLSIYFDRDRPVDFFGNFKRGADNTAEDWGGAFVVARLFDIVGEEADLNAQDKFSPADLKKLIGKEIVIVSYTSGTYEKDGVEKQSYSTWNQAFAVGEDEAEMASEILDAWQKSQAKGYPNNYSLPMSKTPQSGAGFKSKASKASATSAIVIGDDVDDDDDLPF